MGFTTDRRVFTRSIASLGAGVLASDGLARTAPSAGVATEPPGPAGVLNVAQAAQGDTQTVPLAPPDAQAAKVKMPTVVPRQVGFALVELGQLAIEEILPAFGLCRMARPTAFVSGHPEKAKHLSEVYGTPGRTTIYNYENFDAIKDDPAIDVVYIVLPNSMHAEYTIRALKAGKHVLCEKPMATSTAECERMIAAANEAGRKLMIAYRLHYEPFNQKVMQLAEGGQLGQLKHISASNCQDTKAPNIRLSSKLGGGPARDVGIYCINAGRYVTGEEPVEVHAVAHKPDDDSRFLEVPESVTFTLRYPSGVVAQCQCGFGSTVVRQLSVFGTEGAIDLANAFAYRGQVLKVKRGSEDKGDERIEKLLLSPVNHFASEMDHLCECLIAGTEPRTTGDMGLADMRIIQAIEESWMSGKRVELG